MIHIANRTYEVVVDHKNGWKPEAFRDRYSEVLERYDYIVGDWGYNQLRLRGFFKDTHPKATKESSIATLQDYLNEYCNFGCAYFIIEKVPSKHNGNQPQPGSDSDEEDLHLNLEEHGQGAEEAVASVSSFKTAETQSQTPPQQEQKSFGHREKQHHQPKDKPHHHHRRNHHSKQQSQGQAQSHKSSSSAKQQHVKQQ